MPFIGLSYYQQPIDPNVYNWARATGYSNGDVIKIVSNFVTTLKDNAIWSKFDYIYPFITDKTNNADARTQFTWNLVNAASSSAQLGTWKNSKATGSIDGFKNGENDCFITPVRGETELSASYHISLMTTQSQASTDVIDLSCISSGNEYIYFVIGRNSNQQLAASNSGNFFYNSTSAPFYTGLFSLQANTTGNLAEWWNRGSKIGSNTSYNSTTRSNEKIGIGAALTDSTSVGNATTKTYQFASIGQYLTTPQMGVFYNAVNAMQRQIDYAIGSKRAVV